MNAITLDKLFHGHEGAKIRCFRAFNAGMRADKVAKLHIAPILKELEKNAGQEMDSEYIAYMIQYVMTYK